MTIKIEGLPEGQVIKNIKLDISFESGQTAVIKQVTTAQTEQNEKNQIDIPVENRASNNAMVDEEF